MGKSYYNPDETTARVETLNGLLDVLTAVHDEQGGDTPVYASDGEVVDWHAVVNVQAVEGGVVIATPSTLEPRGERLRTAVKEAS